MGEVPLQGFHSWMLKAPFQNRGGAYKCGYKTLSSGVATKKRSVQNSKELPGLVFRFVFKYFSMTLVIGFNSHLDRVRSTNLVSFLKIGL